MYHNLVKLVYMNNLPIIIHDSNIALMKTKYLIKITQKILKNTAEMNSAKKLKISYDQNTPIDFDDGFGAWLDHATGLMWEIKTKENIDFEYVYSEEYIEENIQKSVENGWDVRLKDDVKDIVNYARKLNLKKYIGYDDWRIPSKDELLSLVARSKSNTVGVNNLSYFTKEPLAKNTSHTYWTSSSYVERSDSSWNIIFNYGVESNGSNGNSGLIRCVRG